MIEKLSLTKIYPTCPTDMYRYLTFRIFRNNTDKEKLNVQENNNLLVHGMRVPLS